MIFELHPWPSRIKVSLMKGMLDCYHWSPLGQAVSLPVAMGFFVTIRLVSIYQD